MDCTEGSLGATVSANDLGKTYASLALSRIQKILRASGGTNPNSDLYFLSRLIDLREPLIQIPLTSKAKYFSVTAGLTGGSLLFDIGLTTSLEAGVGFKKGNNFGGIFQWYFPPSNNVKY